MIAAFEESGVVKGWRWSASLSPRTCVACLSRHGKVYPLSKAMDRHVNCRCSASPYIGDGSDVEWESGSDWIKRQPAALQDTVLGREGGSLFRSGNLLLDDFERMTTSRAWGSSVSDGGVQWAKRQAARRVESVPSLERLANDLIAQMQRGGRMEAISVPILKTKAQAQAFFESIGVNVGEIGSNAKAWQVVANGYAKRLNAGQRIERTVTFEANKTLGVMAMNFGFDAKTGELTRRYLSINTGRKIPWKDIDAVIKQQHDSGWMVAKTPEELIDHEIGHLIHRENVTNPVYGNGWITREGVEAQSTNSWRLNDIEMEYGEEAGARRAIAETVSRYAATGVGEFVAEVYTGMSNGLTYPESVMSLFRLLGGVEP
jgi:hypothetical protein